MATASFQVWSTLLFFFRIFVSVLCKQSRDSPQWIRWGINLVSFNTFFSSPERVYDTASSFTGFGTGSAFALDLVVSPRFRRLRWARVFTQARESETGPISIIHPASLVYIISRKQPNLVWRESLFAVVHSNHVRVTSRNAVQIDVLSDEWLIDYEDKYLCCGSDWTKKSIELRFLSNQSLNLIISSSFAKLSTKLWAWKNYFFKTQLVFDILPTFDFIKKT